MWSPDASLTPMALFSDAIIAGCFVAKCHCYPSLYLRCWIQMIGNVQDSGDHAGSPLQSVLTNAIIQRCGFRGVAQILAGIQKIRGIFCRIISSPKRTDIKIRTNPIIMHSNVRFTNIAHSSFLNSAFHTPHSNNMYKNQAPTSRHRTQFLLNATEFHNTAEKQLKNGANKCIIESGAISKTANRYTIKRKPALSAIPHSTQFRIPKEVPSNDITPNIQSFCTLHLAFCIAPQAQPQ